MPNLRIIDLPSGSITDNQLTYIGEPVSGALSNVSFRQMKDYFQGGFQPTNLSTGHFFVGNAFGTASDAGSSLIWSEGSGLTINGGFIGNQGIDNFDLYFGAPSGFILGQNQYSDRIGFFVEGGVQYMFTDYGTPVFPNLSSSVGSTASLSPLVIDASGNITYNAWPSGGSGGNINTGSLLLTSSFDAFTSSFNSYSGSINNQISNILASESKYLSTSSFNNFSSSYVNTSASIVNILSEITASGGGVSFVEFNSFTASLNSLLSNIYASESNYTLTSSFTSFEARYQADSSSFLSLIFGITGSGGGVNVSAFNAFTASTNSSLNTLTTAGTFNFIVGDTQSFTPHTGSTVFSSSLLVNRSIVMFCQESYQLAPFYRNGITCYSFTSSMGVINMINGEFDSGSYYYIQYK